MLVPLTLLILSAAPDTVRLTPDEALARARETSPRVEAALQRSRRGAAAADQARAWPNPLLAMTVENIGAAEAVTGLPAPRGLEGQAVLGFRLPVGGDRGAAIRQADALARAASADASYVAGDAVVATVYAVATAERDRALAEQAIEEAGTLTALAEALSRQAAEGRASEGHAARVYLAAALAQGTAADRKAAAAASSGELARLLGLTPDQVVEIGTSACAATQPASAMGAPPEVEAARARAEAAAAGLDLARAARIPDVEPQVGFRRAAGTQALYVGLAFELPFFNRRGGATTAAEAEWQASQADVRDIQSLAETERLAARQALDALDAAGARFRGDWMRNLDRTVEATEARYQLGEGTLVELLDGRRARFEAQASRERWRAAWRIQRARLSRLSGGEATPDLFCDPLASQD